MTTLRPDRSMARSSRSAKSPPITIAAVARKVGWGSLDRGSPRGPPAPPSGRPPASRMSLQHGGRCAAMSNHRARPAASWSIINCEHRGRGRSTPRATLHVAKALRDVEDHMVARILCDAELRSTRSRCVCAAFSTSNQDYSGKRKMPGIHHVSHAGNASRKIEFYTRTFGLRLVKKTVNFDDPGTYHFLLW